jgi:hypothetical protein
MPNQFSGCRKFCSLTSLTYWFSPIQDDLAGLSEDLGHARLEARVQAKHIMVDQGLSVGVQAGVQTDDKAVFGPFGDQLVQTIGNHLQQDGKCAGLFQCFGRVIFLRSDIYSSAFT